MKQLIECVPNFSEGWDTVIIEKIAEQIRSVSGVTLLNVDSGKAANRTVMTFVGEPLAVVEAAYRSIKIAGELIDMSRQTGEHPRMGATDVCPLIPISNISIDEVAGYAGLLAERIGHELNIPVYLYEHSQKDQSRNNLSVIRAGEYEGFFKKIKLPGWQPDFGPSAYDAKRGATVIGARDFLIAYNVNLNTASVEIAAAIAADVRESGRKLLDTKTGTVIRDETGKPMVIPGSLKHVKAMGWFIKEYGIAQVSMNLTNIEATPIHKVFEEVRTKATAHGVKVTGSELIGLIPLSAMVAAGKYFMAKQQRLTEATERELIDTAIQTMGLSELAPFDPDKRIIEYVLVHGS